MKIFDVVDACERFKMRRMDHAQWRVSVLMNIMELDEAQARMLAEHIVDFKSRDNGDV